MRTFLRELWRWFRYYRHDTYVSPRREWWWEEESR